MISVEEATEVLYTVLSTRCYEPTGYYTVSEYSHDPLYTAQHSEFTLDPTLNHSKFITTRIGPAA